MPLISHCSETLERVSKYFQEANRSKNCQRQNYLRPICRSPTAKTAVLSWEKLHTGATFNGQACGFQSTTSLAGAQRHEITFSTNSHDVKSNRLAFRPYQGESPHLVPGSEDHLGGTACMWSVRVTANRLSRQIHADVSHLGHAVYPLSRPSR